MQRDMAAYAKDRKIILQKLVPGTGKGRYVLRPAIAHVTTNVLSSSR